MTRGPGFRFGKRSSGEGGPQPFEASREPSRALTPSPESLSSTSCPLLYPDALFMAHYSPPADAQMLSARAVTLRCPLERTKGAPSPSSSHLPSSRSLLGSRQALGVWHGLSPLPGQENRLVSRCLCAEPAHTFGVAVAVSGPGSHQGVCRGGWGVCACVRHGRRACMGVTTGRGTQALPRAHT